MTDEAFICAVGCFLGIVLAVSAMVMGMTPVAICASLAALGFILLWWLTL